MFSVRIRVESVAMGLAYVSEVDQPLKRQGNLMGRHGWMAGQTSEDESDELIGG